MNYAQIGDWKIPALIAGGLARYTLGNVRPGSGLHAILRGDLFEAIACYDPETTAYISNIVRVIAGYAPSASWGSSSTVDRWIRNDDNWTSEQVSDRHRKIWEGFTDA